jgi:hypothetical protein
VIPSVRIPAKRCFRYLQRVDVDFRSGGEDTVADRLHLRMTFETLETRLFRDRGRKIHHGLSHMGQAMFRWVIEIPTGRAAAAQRGHECAVAELSQHGYDGPPATVAHPHTGPFATGHRRRHHRPHSRCDGAPPAGRHPPSGAITATSTHPHARPGCLRRPAPAAMPGISAGCPYSRTFTAHDRGHLATVRLRTSRLTWRFAYTCPAKMPGEGRLTATRISREDGDSGG